jgi:hypothetical protein
MKRMAWIMAAAAAAFAQSGAPKIDEIMARVAQNQAKSVEARKQFVYKQDELLALRHANGKLACQTTREWTVVPGAKGIDKKLVKIQETGDGSCDKDDKSKLHVDQSVMEGMSDDGEKHKSEDDVPRDLFPLTAREQRHYDYRLVGEETYRERQVYRVAFQPKRNPEHDDEGAWKGEALIDAQEFQPVQVVTDLAAKIPAAVRILLGTNVRGVGFSVSYARVADGVWFPASFGGEFKVNALFFYRRSITINVKNSDFKRADVNSSVAFDKIQ